jgi:hypothetical protein
MWPVLVAILIALVTSAIASILPGGADVIVSPPVACIAESRLKSVSGGSR